MKRADLARRARRAAVVTARTGSLAAARLIGRVVAPAPVASWLVAGARVPQEEALRAVVRLDGLRAPEPADVVGNYLRGMVLFGAVGRRDRAFEWRWDPVRGVIDAESRHVPDRVRRHARRLGFDVRFDSDFSGALAASRREEWTWITGEVAALYERLFALGFASSVEVYRDGELVGGTWGILVGRTFGAMSIFHGVDHVGSIALQAMVDAIGPEGRWDLVDVGLVKPSTARFGARTVPVAEFTQRVLRGLVAHPAPTPG